MPTTTWISTPSDASWAPFNLLREYHGNWKRLCMLPNLLISKCAHDLTSLPPQPGPVVVSMETVSGFWAAWNWAAAGQGARTRWQLQRIDTRRRRIITWTCVYIEQAPSFTHTILYCRTVVPNLGYLAYPQGLFEKTHETIFQGRAKFS